MRFLVIGKAKTGTTALTYIIKEACSAQAVLFEPKSISTILDNIHHTKGGNALIKVIFEHFDGKYNELNALINGDLEFSIEKVIFIFRDVRDQMISKLLYLSKEFRHNYPETAWRQWITTLKQKERNPTSLSFF